MAGANDDAPSLATQKPYYSSVGRNGVTVVLFKEATFFVRPDTFGIAQRDFTGRGPEVRWLRARITRLRVGPAARYLDGAAAKSLLVDVEGRDPVLAVYRAPADEVWETAAYLCTLLGLPAPPGYVPKPAPPPPLPSDPASRAERAWRWLHESSDKTPPGDAAQTNLTPVIEYSVEGTGDLLIQRGWGYLRIFVPAPGWKAFWRGYGFFGGIVWLAILLVIIWHFPRRGNGSEVPLGLIVLFYTSMGSGIISACILNTHSPRLIEVDTHKLSTIRRGLLARRHSYRCDEIIRISRLPGAFGQIVIKLGDRPEQALTGPVATAHATIIVGQLRLALGFDGIAPVA